MLSLLKIAIFKVSRFKVLHFMKILPRIFRPVWNGDFRYYSYGSGTVHEGIKKFRRIWCRRGHVLDGLEHFHRIRRHILIDDGYRLLMGGLGSNGNESKGNPFFPLHNFKNSEGSHQTDSRIYFINKTIIQWLISAKLEIN